MTPEQQQKLRKVAGEFREILEHVDSRDRGWFEFSNDWLNALDSFDGEFLMMCEGCDRCSDCGMPVQSCMCEEGGDGEA